MSTEESPSGTWVDSQDEPGSSFRVREVKLAVLDGPDAGQSKVFGKTPIVLGRNGGDLALTDRKVSALHAELRLGPNGYRLRDLGSTNGTFVMGLQILDAFVHAGAVIGLGDSAVRFEPLESSVIVPLSTATRLGGLIGASLPMRRLYRQIERAAPSDMTTLVTGETGTGKELVAEAIHDLSERSSGPFVVLDCATVPRGLFGSELFGHERGAFTGATHRHRGVLEQANGGTLFLDELGEIPLDLQPKLLRALDVKSFRRVGGSETISSDFRIIAATNRDLREEVNRGTFRDDLYFRIAVATLETPPLRERVEDIEPLADHFRRGLGEAPLPEAFLGWARSHSWPGNVRELRNAVERALVLGLMPGRPLPPEVFVDIDPSIPFHEAKRAVIASFERRYLSQLLGLHDGNIAAAARAAKIDRMTIYKMLQRLGIERGDTP